MASTAAPRVAALAVVLNGGPVHRERGFVIHDGGPQWDSTLAIGEDLYLTTSREILEAMSKGEGPEHAVIALGCAGWGAGQLEQELTADNSWLTAPPTRPCCSTRRSRSAGRRPPDGSVSTCRGSPTTRGTPDHGARRRFWVSTSARADRRFAVGSVSAAARDRSPWSTSTRAVRTGPRSNGWCASGAPTASSSATDMTLDGGRPADTQARACVRARPRRRFGKPVMLIDSVRRRSKPPSVSRASARRAASADATPGPRTPWAAAIIIERWLAAPADAVELEATLIG